MAHETTDGGRDDALGQVGGYFDGIGTRDLMSSDKIVFTKRSLLEFMK
jgi:hypothetical protein